MAVKCEAGSLIWMDEWKRNCHLEFLEINKTRFTRKLVEGSTSTYPRLV